MLFAEILLFLTVAPQSHPHLTAVKSTAAEVAHGGIYCRRVAFPAFKTHLKQLGYRLGLRLEPLKGILRDRPVARMSMFSDKYVPELRPDGTIELTNAGFSVRDNFDAPGTDAEAVRKGYISISKLSAF